MSLLAERKRIKVTRPSRGERTTVSLTDQQKAAVVLRNCQEKLRFADGCDASMTGCADQRPTARTMAAKQIGIGRSKFSLVLNGHEVIKNPEQASALDLAVRKVIAEPGSSRYQAMWAKLCGYMEKSASPEALWFAVPAAYHSWAPIALDLEQTEARRLQYGRMAEYTLFRFAHVLAPKEQDATLASITVEQAADVGRRVTDAIAEIVSANKTAPEGLFFEGTSEAQAFGYRIFKVRILADRVGWFGGKLRDDAERSRILTDAFKAGMADDLMWINNETGGTEVAHPNNAFNLALHASEWRRAAEYGCALLTDYPALLTSSIAGLTAICDDYTVYPGIAAVLADETLIVPANIRRLLNEPSEKTLAMRQAVAKMIDGGLKDKTYLKLLALGASS